MKHNYVINSNQLVLRPIAYRDLEQIRVWRNEEHIRKWFIDQQVIDPVNQKKWFEKYLNADDDMMFVAELESRPIGTVALYNINNEEKSAEFGRLMIGEESVRGLKIGQKITEEICGFGFDILGLYKMNLEVFDENVKAIKIYGALGFIKESEFYLNDKSILKMRLTRDQHLKIIVLK